MRSNCDNAIQLKWSERKGCQIFEVKMKELNEYEDVRFHNEMMIYETNYHSGVDSREKGRQEGYFEDKYPCLQNYGNVYPK